MAVVLTAAIGLRPAVDNDLWWHLRIRAAHVSPPPAHGADVLSTTTQGKTRVAFD